MKKFTTVSGKAAPLMRSQIDTDVIIRIDRLTSLTKDKLGPYAFEALRYHSDGSEIADFVLNRPEFRGAPVLLAGANFGCGSSREGAVWALMCLGVRCVIAESFGDIFYNNCFQNGVLPIVLPGAVVDDLARQAAAGGTFAVDLVAQSIRAPDGTSIPLSIDPNRRKVLLEGLDDIGQTLVDADAIAAWQVADRAARPWVWNTGGAVITLGDAPISREVSV